MKLFGRINLFQLVLLLSFFLFSFSFLFLIFSFFPFPLFSLFYYYFFDTASDLDEAFPTQPVWLRRIDGHCGWANSAAMETADIPGRNPKGGS